MALNFPDNPTVNQVYADPTAGFYYKWDGTVWQSYSPSSSGNIKVLDDISGSFSGIGQTFGLTSGGVEVIPLNAGQVVINLGGVVQSPTIDYTVSNSNITFTTPPGGGLSFSGISLGSAIPLTTPAESITPDKLSTGGPWWQTNYNVGIGTTIATSALNVIGDANISGVITANTFKGQINSGISTITNLTAQQVNVVGGATTALIVQGDARITGILTIGTGSIVLNGSTNNITGIASITDTSNRKLVALNTGGTNAALWYQAAAPTGWTKVTTHHNKALRIVNTSGGGSGGTIGFTTAFTSKTPTGTVSGSNSGGSVANTTATGSVSGSNSGGSVTGSVSGSNSGGSVNSTTLSTSEIPSHTHNLQVLTTDPGGSLPGGAPDYPLSYGNNGTFNSTLSHPIQNTGGGGSHGHGFNNPSWSGSWSQGTFTNPSWSGSVSINAHNHSFTNPSWSGSFSGTAIDFSVQYVDMILCSFD